MRLGVADVIADVVSTGTTLRQAGLEIVGEPILRVRGGAGAAYRRAADSPAVDQLVRRMQGVIIARRYVLMDYDIRAELVEEAVAAHARHRVADGLAAARPGLGRGARDGAAGRHQPDHGRALGARRARHPRHRHPRLPAVSPAWRPSAGRRCSGRGGPGSSSTPCAAALLVVLVGVAFAAARRAAQHGWGLGSRLARGRVSRCGCVWFLHRLAAVRVVTDDDGVHGRQHPAPAPAGVGRGRRRPALARRPWMMLDLSDGSALAAMGVQKLGGGAGPAAGAGRSPGWSRPRAAGPTSRPLPAEPVGCPPTGTWRSLVAHLTGGQGVAGSNPVVPTREVGGPGAVSSAEGVAAPDRSARAGSLQQAIAVCPRGQCRRRDDTQGARG